jgi:hypothetical protein
MCKKTCTVLRKNQYACHPSMLNALTDAYDICKQNNVLLEKNALLLLVVFMYICTSLIEKNIESPQSVDNEGLFC